jgi:hypothetical protein
LVLTPLPLEYTDGNSFPLLLSIKEAVNADGVTNAVNVITSVPPHVIMTALRTYNILQA